MSEFNRNAVCSLLTILVFSFFLIACDDDNGTSSEFASVSGTIFIENTAMYCTRFDIEAMIIW